LPQAIAAAQRTAALKQRAGRSGLPIIYVNDMLGDWRTDQRTIYARCTRSQARGASIARLLKPSANDYFLTKPAHSAFYCTALPPLLEALDVGTLILTGLAVDMCVLFTANDGHLRQMKLHIPRDCTAAIDRKRYQTALGYLQDVLKADTRPSDVLSFARGNLRAKLGSVSWRTSGTLFLRADELIHEAVDQRWCFLASCALIALGATARRHGPQTVCMISVLDIGVGELARQVEHLVIEPRAESFGEVFEGPLDAVFGLFPCSPRPPQRCDQRRRRRSTERHWLRSQRSRRQAAETGSQRQSEDCS